LVCMFIIVISSSWIITFMKMTCPSLPLQNSFGLKSTFSKCSYCCLHSDFISLAYFFHPVTLSLCLSLPARYVSHRQQSFGSSLLIQTCCRSMSFDWRAKTINIYSYYWNIVIIPFILYLSIVVLESFLVLICFSAHLAFSWLC
jgi:hypothetical protein